MNTCTIGGALSHKGRGILYSELQKKRVNARGENAEACDCEQKREKRKAVMRLQGSRRRGNERESTHPPALLSSCDRGPASNEGGEGGNGAISREPRPRGHQAKARKGFRGNEERVIVKA